MTYTRFWQNIKHTYLELKKIKNGILTKAKNKEQFHAALNLKRRPFDLLNKEKKTVIIDQVALQTISKGIDIENNWS